MKNKFLILSIISVISLFLLSLTASAVLPNYPAYWDALENKNINEDSTGNILVYQNIKYKCHDPDDPIRIFSIASKHNHYKLSISRNNLYLSNLEPNYDKTERVILNCNGVYGSFNLIINPIDDPAVWSPLDNQNILEDSADNTIVYSDLSSRCTDIDSPINMQITSIHNYYSLSFSNTDLIISNMEQDYKGAEIVALNCNNIPTSFVLTVSSVNDAPVLSSIDNQITNENQLLTFTISANDIDNDILTYSATNLPQGSNFDESTRTFTWTPTYNQAGIYTVSFHVTDSSLTDTKQITITVNNINRAPVLDNIADIIVNENELVQINPTATDPDGDIITYTYTPPLNENGEWQTNYNDAGTYTVTVTASDGNLQTSQDVTISVNNINRAPTWNIIPQDQTIPEDTSLSYQISASDPDGDTLTYSVDNSEFTINSNGLLTWTPELNWNGDKSVIITVSDGVNSITSNIKITVSPVNDAPIVSDIPDQTINEGSSFTQINLDEHVSDIDNLDTEITWTYSGNTQLIISINNRIATITTPNLNWYGSETITFRAADPGNLYNENQATFTVTHTNRAPVISNLPDLNTNEDSTPPSNWIDLHQYTADPDNLNTELSFSISSQSNPSLINCYITNNRYLNCNPPAPNEHGTSDISIEVSDAHLTSEDDFTITINPIDDPAVWSPLDNQNILEDSADNTIVYSDLSSKCTDIDSPINMQITSIHNYYSLSFSNTDLVISNMEQDYNGAEIVALNCNNIPTSFVLTVSSVNDAPVLFPIDNQITNENQLLTFTLSANDIDNDILTYSATNLPQGSNFDESTRTFTWTPTYNQAGTYTVDFHVTDSYLTASRTITITVNNANRAPIWDIIPQDQAIQEDTSLSYQLSASDPDGDALTYAVNAPEFSINSNGLLTWTPELNWNGDKFVTITVSDGVNSITSNIKITVTPRTNNKPTITSKPITTTLVNQQYTYDVEAEDIDNDILTYSLINAPEGMSINSETGLITWIPSAIGTYPIIVQAQDEHATLDTQSYILQVTQKIIPSKPKYKKKHLFNIGSISLPTNSYSGKGTIEGFIQLRNIGQLKEKNIELMVSIPELKIEAETDQNINLGPQDNKWVEFNLPLPAGVSSGEYLLKIDIHNQYYSETKYLPILIEN